MKTRKVYIPIAAIAILLVSVLVWKFTFRTAETSVASVKADSELTAASLLEDFVSDENHANSLYLGKVILITGAINSISEDSLGVSVYLKESNADAGVMCSFDKENVNINQLDKGQIVKIKGICTGYLMDVVLNKCSLEPAIKQQ
jgi:hypothetical protein